jgi:hypothetical protein
MRPTRVGNQLVLRALSRILSSCATQEIVKLRELLGINPLQLRSGPHAPRLKFAIAFKPGDHGLRFSIHLSGRQTPEAVRIAARLDPLGVDGGPVSSGERI